MADYVGDDVLKSLEQAQNYNKALVKKIQNQVLGSIVLDFGAGSGTFARSLRTATRQIHCVEADSGYVHALKEEGFPATTSVTDYTEEFFTGAYTLNVLEHIEDDRSALADVAKTMKVGGNLVVFVPAHPILYSSFDRRIGHFRRYSKDNLLRALEGSGFSIVKWEFFDSVGFFVALLYRVIDRGDGRLSHFAVRVFDAAVFPLSRLFDKLLNRLLGKNLFVVAKRIRV